MDRGPRRFGASFLPTDGSLVRYGSYRSLFIQARGVLKKELLAHLRATRAIRRSRYASLKRDGLGQIVI